MLVLLKLEILFINFSRNLRLFVLLSNLELFPLDKFLFNNTNFSTNAKKLLIVSLKGIVFYMKNEINNREMKIGGLEIVFKFIVCYIIIIFIFVNRLSTYMHSY